MYDISGFGYDIRDVVRVLNLTIRRKNAKSYDVDCPFCNHKLHDAYQSVLTHARGRVVGSFKQKYSRRVAHDAYAEYLEKLQDRAGR